jgi:hypothetical protein
VNRHGLIVKTKALTTEIPKKSGEKCKMAIKTLKCLFVSLLALVLSGCFIQTELKLDSSGNLVLQRMRISIDAGEEVVEASVRHALNILGLRDSFNITEYEPRDFDMSDYMDLTPTKTITVNSSSSGGDSISVTDMGDQKMFEWVMEPRSQLFESAVGREDSDNQKVFLVLRIRFPGKVSMANTSESSGNEYIWRITNSQIKEQVKIQAMYSPN